MTLSEENRKKINNLTTNLVNTGLFKNTTKKSIMDSIDVFNEPTYEYINSKFMENNEKEKSYSIYKDTFQRKDISSEQTIYIKSFNNLFLKSDGKNLSLEINEDTIKAEAFEFTINKEEGSNFIELADNNLKYVIGDNNKLILQSKTNTDKDKWKLTPYNNYNLIESVYKTNNYIDASIPIEISEGIKDSSKWELIFKSDPTVNYKADTTYFNTQKKIFEEKKNNYYTLLNEYKKNLINITLLNQINDKLQYEYNQHNTEYIKRLSLIKHGLRLTKYQELKKEIVNLQNSIADLKKEIDEKEKSKIDPSLIEEAKTQYAKLESLKQKKSKELTHINNIVKKLQIDETLRTNIKAKNEILKNNKQKAIQKEITALKATNETIKKSLESLKSDIINFIKTLEKESINQNENTKDILLQNEVILNKFNNTNFKNELANKKNKKLNENQLKLKYNQEFLDSERKFLKSKSIFLLFITIMVFIFIFSAIVSIIMNIYNIYT